VTPPFQHECGSIHGGAASGARWSDAGAPCSGCAVLVRVAPRHGQAE